MIFEAIKNLRNSFKQKPITLNMDEKSAKSIIDQYNEMKLSADAFIEKTNLSNEAMESYLHTVKSGDATFAGCIQSINKTNKSIGLMGIKTKVTTAIVNGLKFALSTMATMLIANLISYVFTSIINGSKKAAEAAEEAREKIDELNSSFKNNKKTVDDIKERYAELAQGIDTLTNKNLTLSDDDYKEFLDLSNQLAKLFPELTINYDKNGNAILDLQGNISSIIGTLDTLIEKERQLANQKIIENLPAIFNEFRQNVNKYEEEIEEFEKKYNATQKLYQTTPSFIGEGFEEGLSVIQWQFDNISEDEINTIKDEINNILKASGMWIDDSYLSSGELNDNTRYAQLFIEDKYLDEISAAINNRIIGLANEINSSKGKLEAEISSFNSDLYSWLSNDAVFKSQDDDKQNIIKQLLFKDNWLKDAYTDPNVDEEEWTSMAKWLQTRYINAINKINQEDIKKKLLDLFNVKLNPNEKIKTAQELQDYFAKENINIPLNFVLDGETEGSTQNLINRMESSISNITGGDEKGIAELKKYTSNFTEEQMNTWLKVTLGITNAGEAIKEYENYINRISKQNSIEFFTEDNIEKVDAYKKKISDLSSYLQTINEKHELSADDMATLNTEYKIFANSVEEYEQKIIEKMNEIASTDKIMIALAEAIETCDNAAEKSRLQALYDTLSKLNIEAQKSADAFGNLATAISSLQSKAELLRELNISIRDVGYIDSSKIDDIISAYPELTEKVAEYNAGLITSSELFNVIEEAYEKDAKNYKIAVAYKLQDNKEFYDKVKDAIPDWLKEQAESYGIDFDYYKTLCEAKLALDKEYLRKKSSLELKTKIAESVITNEDGTIKPPSYFMAKGAALATFPNYDKEKKEFEEYEKFLEDFNDTLSTVINFNTSWKDYGKDKNSSTEINWIEQSLSILQNEVDKFQTELENTYGIENQINAIDKLNDALENLKGGYESAYVSYKNQYQKALGKLGNSSSIKYKIESGEEFDITKYDSDTASIIQEAMEYYSKILETKEKINEITKQINDNENIEKVKVRLEGYEAQAELINTMLEDETLKAKEKNKLLEQEKELKNNILQQNLLLAKTEEERLKYQEEYNNYLAQNENTQYENLRSERNNKISYYESRIQDVQNLINLAETSGGQGTESQYLKMNEFLDKQIDYEKKNLENAIKMRDKAQWGTEEWTQYNDEIQNAQDNINKAKIAQIENNKAILLLPVKQYEELNEELQEELDLLNEYQSKVESAIGYASTLIQDQVDILNENKENISDYWDEQIESVQKQKDELTESNDELKRQIDLENAKYNLEKAMRNKTSRIYRRGEGFVYESNQEDIRQAQQELDDLTYNNQISEYDKIIDEYNKKKESEIKTIDDQIEAWENYADKIQKATESYEKFIAMQDLIQVFGSGAISSILNQDEAIIGNFERTLNAVKTETDEIQQKIDANEKVIKSIQEEAETFASTSQTVVEAKKKIKEAIIDNEEEIKAIEQRTQVVGELSSTWSETEENIVTTLGNLNEAIISAKDSEFETLSERINNLKSFKRQASDIYSSIAQILNNAQSAMNSLDNLQNKANNLSSTSINKTTLTTTGLQQYHSGGVVDSGSKKLPNTLVALTGDNLKSNEVLAKLLNNEVVLTQPQVGNLFNNLGKAYNTLIPNALNTSNNNDVSVTIGDINVYNPDNSDMIVNEIVKELPLKVIQKLNTK